MESVRSKVWGERKLKRIGSKVLGRGMCNGQEERESLELMLAITSSHLVTVALSFQTMMRRKENVISILVRNKPAQDWGVQIGSYCLYTRRMSQM